MTTQKKSSEKTKKTSQSKITQFFKRDNENNVSSDSEFDFSDDETSENSNPCCFCGIEMGPNRLSQYCSRQCLYGN
jgi:hypothetical protein